jgi:hypothetical protein
VFSVTLGFANIPANPSNPSEYTSTSAQFKFFNLSNYIFKNGFLVILLSCVLFVVYVIALLNQKYSKNKSFFKLTNKHLFSDFLFLILFPFFSLLFCFSLLNIVYFDFQSAFGIFNFVFSVICIVALLTGNHNLSNLV